MVLLMKIKSSGNAVVHPAGSLAASEYSDLGDLAGLDDRSG